MLVAFEPRFFCGRGWVQTLLLLNGLNERRRLQPPYLRRLEVRLYLSSCKLFSSNREVVPRITIQGGGSETLQFCRPCNVIFVIATLRYYYCGLGRESSRLQNCKCKSPAILIIVDPYCVLPRDYLSDTSIPIPCAMGFRVSQHEEIGCDAPPPSIVHLRCDTPNRTLEVYLGDTRAIPHESNAKCVRYPLCDTISKRFA